MGLTSLTTGERVAKDDIRVEICGEADELNSFLGLVASLNDHEDLNLIICRLQHEILAIAGGLQTPSIVPVEDRKITDLEQDIDRLDKTLEPISHFILPGGTPAAAACHTARAVCRRIERKLVSISGREPLPGPVLQYFNRLGDLLFILARALNQRSGKEEIRWNNPSTEKGPNP